MKKILITGGAGFIGSHVVKLFVRKYPGYKIINIDSLTYAGNLENLEDVEREENYEFERADIADPVVVDRVFGRHKPEAIIHLAAESHVDRSIKDPLSFIKTNVMGTVNLLKSFRELHDSFEDKIFYHISTDEVFGSLGDTGLFDENTPYSPNSPYSASKASSDHFVRAFGETYDIPYLISNCSNNYGPNQFPEKLIPLFIKNIIDKKPLPVYGNGNYTRDWLHVVDHAHAIDLVFHRGRSGETYTIGGLNELTNNDLIKILCELMDKKLNREAGFSAGLITSVDDRPGHDLRYAIDATKICKELGWAPTVTFEEGLEATVNWYLDNLDWLERVTSGKYMSYYKDNNENN